MNAPFEIRGFVELTRRNTVLYQPHWHRDIEIIIIFNGEIHFTVGDNSYEAHAGDCIFIFPYLIHSYTANKDLDAAVFIFPTDFSFGIETVLNNYLPSSPIIPKEIWDAFPITPLAEEILAHYDTSSELVKKSYLLFLFSRVMEQVSMIKNTWNKSFNAQECLCYCHQHYREPLTISTVAKAMHTNKDYISHFFKHVVQQSFPLYINSMRIADSLVFLLQTELPISEIASRCGFSSTRTFLRVFERHTGMSPKKYREQEPSKKHPKD